jgi:DNA-binding CsgD family transcriptional regulator
MLDGFGLTPDEQEVYVALLDVPSASADELSAACPRARVAMALEGLSRHGLVSRLPGSDPSLRYAAAPPDVGLELIARERERELARARVSMAGLAQRYRQARSSAPPHDVVEVLTTREGTIRRWEQLQRSARVQVRSFDRPPYIDATVNPIEPELLAAGVAYRAVYHPAGFAIPGHWAAVQELVAAGEQARVTASVPVKMFIADDQLGLLPLEVDGSAESCLVIRESSLLDTLIALFELVWERAVAIHADGSLPSVDTGPEPSESELLALLAAGLTDAAIGRHLGTHPRTVQRRVRVLLDRLGAATRFQAGLQAVRRGWLLLPARESSADAGDGQVVSRPRCRPRQ